MAKYIPKITIIGRANVGKSTLFNRLSVDVKSLTYDYAGVTRDIVRDIACWKGNCFELIDTGGMQVGKTDDILAKAVSAKARGGIEQADVIVFMVDGTVGVLPHDRAIAKELYKTKKPIILAINKADSSTIQEHEHEFATLGFEKRLFISATHGTSIGDLLDEIVFALPENKPIEDENEATKEGANYRVVLLGKPNVGKSSLLNLLLKEERTLVADMPGTTREAIGEKISFYHEDILITDTPGIRKKRKVDQPLETMMVKTAFRALDQAHIVLLLVDSSEGRLSDQELKLAFYALEQGKALVILFNKQDLVNEEIEHELQFNLEPYTYLIDKVNTLTISCKTGKNIGRILPLLKKIWQRYTQEFSGQELTMLFKDAFYRRQHFHKTQPLQLIYAKQVRTAPVTIALRVNQPDWFGPSQLAYLEGVMRKKYDLQGVPVQFAVRKKSKKVAAH